MPCTRDFTVNLILFKRVWNYRQCQKLGNIFTGPILHLSFTIISDVYGSFIRNNSIFTRYCLPGWNPLSMAVFGEIHWSGGQSKRNCLQDRTNCDRSGVWQIVLVLKTGISIEKCHLRHKNTTQHKTVWVFWFTAACKQFFPPSFMFYG